MTNQEKIVALLEKQQENIKILAQGLSQLKERVEELESKQFI